MTKDNNNNTPIPKSKTLGERAAYAMFEEAILYAVSNDPEGPITIKMMSSLWHRDKDSWIARLDRACDVFARAQEGLIQKAAKKATTHYESGRTSFDLETFWVEMLTIVRMYDNG